jgi:branched-chain amino acid aminotransferase
MFDSLPGYIWFNGEFKPWTEARIHIMTHGLHYASSVYEGLRSYNGYIFKVKEHYDRLHKSANYLDFQIPYSVDELIGASEVLMGMGGYKEGYIRALSWCGSKKMTVSHNGADINTAICIWERPLSYPENFYTVGIKMNLAIWRRPDPATAPVHSKAAGLYMTSSMSKKSAEFLGFDDSLMLDYKGHIAEATSSNIFLVIDGRLFTPIPNCFLNGITRLTCIDIAKELGIEVVETTLDLEDLSRATEVFLTGTAIEVLPVASIETTEKKWDFKPGKITNAIYDNFKKMVHNLK